jgi:hypothetical protein
MTEKAYKPLSDTIVPEYVKPASKYSISDQIFLKGVPTGYDSGIREQSVTLINDLKEHFIITNITLTVAGAIGVSSPSFVTISLDSRALITCGVDDDTQSQNATSAMSFNIPHVWRRGAKLQVVCVPNPFPQIHFKFTITGYLMNDLAWE